MIILNIRQAAPLLGKTPAALRNAYRRWGVPHFRIGHQVKFTQEALQEWVANRMLQRTEPYPEPPRTQQIGRPPKLARPNARKAHQPPPRN